MMQGNANCSAPKTVIGVTKVANERYLHYLQLCGKDFFCEFHARVCNNVDPTGSMFTSVATDASQARCGAV